MSGSMWDSHLPRPLHPSAEYRLSQALRRSCQALKYAIWRHETETWTPLWSTTFVRRICHSMREIENWLRNPPPPGDIWYDIPRRRGRVASRPFKKSISTSNCFECLAAEQPAPDSRSPIDTTATMSHVTRVSNLTFNLSDAERQIAAASDNFWQAIDAIAAAYEWPSPQSATDPARVRTGINDSRWRLLRGRLRYHRQQNRLFRCYCAIGLPRCGCSRFA